MLGSRGAAGTAWQRLGSKLVIVELATAVVLLVGAGLLGKSLYQLLRVDLGLEPNHLAAVTLAAPRTYATNEQLVALERRILDRVAALPGVTSVGASSRMPLNAGNTMWIELRAVRSTVSTTRCNIARSAPDTFRRFRRACCAAATSPSKMTRAGLRS